MSELWRRVLALFRRERFARELDEEMQFHLALLAEENPEDARRRFGSATLAAEDSREVWGWGPLERLGQDLRHAARMLRKNPGFSAVAVFTLAAGIGANTLIYSVVHAVLLAPLPYRDPDRLISLQGRKTGWINWMSAPDVADIRAQSTAFEDIALIGHHAGDLTGSGEPEHLTGSRVSANLFSLLGVSASVGRGFEAAGEQVIVLSHALWQRRFGGDPAIIGKAIALGKQTRTIVGVMPSWFQFPDEKTEYWVPLVPQGSERWLTARAVHVFRVVARLKPGATLERARLEVKTIAARLERAYPASNAGWSADAVPLAESVIGGVRSALLVLFGAVGLVLLVACANVANLLLSRGAQRRQEMALRAALGAGGWRLVRMLFSESLLLAVLGGALGVLLALWGLRALLPLYPPGLPRAAAIRLNVPVLAFTMLVSLGTALLAGLLPALRISRTDLNADLKSGVRAGGTRTGRFRAALVVAQVALAMVLLTCAGLLVRSFLLRTRVSGFDPAGVLAVELPDLPPARFAAVLERLRTIPGVTAVGASTSFAYTQMMSIPVDVPGRPKEDEPVSPQFEIVTPGYFRTLKIPLRKGRAIEERDGATAPPVMVVNEALARRVYPGEDPLGKQIRMLRQWRTVVGVVGDVPMYATDRPPKPAIYLPYFQVQEDFGSPTMVALRTAVPPQSLAGAVRSAVRAVEPNTPIVRMATLREELAGLVASPRFYTLLLSLFAAAALALAALGVYGITSFAVRLRTHEIGVRMALGASAAGVLKATLRQGAALAAAGVAIGSLASLWATRLLVSTSLLFRVRPADPLTFLSVPAVLLAAALAACFIPARRATRINPTEALRYE